MKEEYNFTLTVPLSDIDEALLILGEAQANNRNMRLSRKPDRQEKPVSISGSPASEPARTFSS